MRANGTAKLEVLIQLTLNEQEAVFLDALTGYGPELLLRVFKQLGGTHYLYDCEPTVPTFCETVRAQIPAILERARSAREVFNGTRKAVQV
jgi:hypothetical protein